MEFKLRNVTYPRYQKNKKNGYELSGYVNYDAWFLAGGVRVRNQFANKFPVATYMKSGIDKLDLTLNRNFVNEENPLIESLTNGGVSFSKISEYLHTYIHRESILHDENVRDQLIEIFWNLSLHGFFKIPMKKVKLDLNYNPISEPEYFNYTFNDKKEFFKIILSQIGFSNIELFFDELLDVLALLNESEFNVIKGSTYYSKDYQPYQNGSKKPSVLAVYDKTGQLKRVKNEIIDYHVHRIELRGYKNRISMMKSLDCLDGNYEQVFQNFAEPFAKQLRKLKIDFSSLYGALSEDSKFRELLDIAFPKNKGSKHTPNKIKPEIEEHSEKDQDSSMDYSISDNDLLFLFFNKISKSLKYNNKPNGIKRFIFSCVINIANSFLYRSHKYGFSYAIRGP